MEEKILLENLNSCFDGKIAYTRGKTGEVEAISIVKNWGKENPVQAIKLLEAIGKWKNQNKPSSWWVVMPNVMNTRAGEFVLIIMPHELFSAGKDYKVLQFMEYLLREMSTPVES